MEGLNGGLSMAEIARREGITERGLRKYVRNLIARRAPEATGEFIAVQMNRLNEALLVSFGAMSGANLPAVDRVVKIVRELDRYHGLNGGARGTEKRRKLLESLDSGAEIDPFPVAEDDSSDPLADILLDPAACLGDRLSQEHGARGTGMRRNPLESLDSGAGTAPNPTPHAGEAWSGEAAEADAELISELDAFLAGLAQPGGRTGARGTGMRRNPLESLDSGAGLAPAACHFAEGGSGEEGAEDAAAERTPDPAEVVADLVPPSSRPEEPGSNSQARVSPKCHRVCEFGFWRRIHEDIMGRV